MALETVTDKTQQPPAAADGTGSLYDQIMAKPPATTAAPDAGVKAQDTPAAPGATAATLDRSAAPETVVAVPGGPTPTVDKPAAAKSDTTVVAPPGTDQTLAPPAATDVKTGPGPGDVPVAPGTTTLPTADAPVAPGAPTAPATDAPVAPGAPTAPAIDAPAAPGAVAPQRPVEGVEDKGNCDFKPDFEYKTEHGRAWKAQSDQNRQQPLELNERGRYQVAFGDSLSTIAERNLKGSGMSADRDSVKAEIANIVNANKNRYPSMDCNTHFVKTGWTLDLPRHQPGEAPPQRPPVERPPAERPPVERPRVEAPPRAERPRPVEIQPPNSVRSSERRYDGHGNVIIERADNVNIYGQDTPRAVPTVRNSNQPYYPDDQPVYAPERSPVVYRNDDQPIYQGDDYPQRRHRAPVVIDARFGDDDQGWGRQRWQQPQQRWEQPRWNQSQGWGQQQQPWNDDCFGTGRSSFPQDNWRMNQRPQIALDFGHDFRQMRRGIPNFGGSMPYFGHQRGGYRGGNSISLQFRI